MIWSTPVRARSSRVVDDGETSASSPPSERTRARTPRIAPRPIQSSIVTPSRSRAIWRWPSLVERDEPVVQPWCRRDVDLARDDDDLPAVLRVHLNRQIHGCLTVTAHPQGRMGEMFEDLLESLACEGQLVHLEHEPARPSRMGLAGRPDVRRGLEAPRHRRPLVPPGRGAQPARRRAIGRRRDRHGVGQVAHLPSRDRGSRCG